MEEEKLRLKAIEIAQHRGACSGEALSLARLLEDAKLILEFLQTRSAQD